MYTNIYIYIYLARVHGLECSQPSVSSKFRFRACPKKWLKERVQRVARDIHPSFLANGHLIINVVHETILKNETVDKRAICCVSSHENALNLT